MNDLPIVVGYLKDGGNLYNNYKEDACVVDEEFLSMTIKANYCLSNSFWVIVRRKNDTTREN